MSPSPAGKYSASMIDYKELTEFFGGSIFPEEFRGNLDSISDKINTNVIDALHEYPVDERANIMLCKAVYGMLSGNLKDAEAILDRSLKLIEEGLDQRSIVRFELYKFYLAYIRRLPPILRFRSGFHNLALEVRDCELQFNQSLSKAHQAARDLWGTNPRMADMFESVFFTDLYTFGTYLTFAMMVHPTHPPAPMNANILQSLQPISDGVKTNVALLGHPNTEGYVARLEFEGCEAQGNAASAHKLRQLFQLYDRSNDAVGKGMCKIMEGDSILSRPFTSPIALNLIPIAHGPGWNDPVWDPTEPAFPLRKKEDAERCYDQALQYMTVAGADRGQATVYLRRGCISHAEGIGVRPQDLKAANQLFNEADLSFDAAERFYTGDGSALLLVKCHRLLLDISRDKVREATRTAEVIGTEAYEAGNTGMSQFCGTLMLRFGRRQFLDHSLVSQGLLCCRCAQICFANSYDYLSELQAMVADADLLTQSHNIPMAVNKVAEIRALGSPLRPALRHLDSLAASYADTQATMRAARFNVLSYVDQTINRVYSAAEEYTQAEDHTLRESWNLEKVGLRPGGAGLNEDTDIEVPEGNRSSAEAAGPDPEINYLIEEFARMLDGYPNETDPYAANASGAIHEAEGSLDGPPVLEGAISSENSTKSDILVNYQRFLSQTNQEILASNPGLLRNVGSAAESLPLMDSIVAQYQRCVNESYKALQKSDIDEWDGLWKEFLRKCETVPEDHQSSIGSFKVIALSQLGDFAGARELLPSALPSGYPTQESDESRKNMCNFQHFQLYATAAPAETAISTCFIAQDWAMGLQCLRSASIKDPGYLVRENSSMDPKSWALLTYIAAIYEHNGKDEEAFGWYLDAVGRLETVRRNITNLDARIELLNRIHTGELYAGLARVCFTFARDSSIGVTVKSPQHWGLAAGSWLDHALLFLEKGRARALLDVMLVGSDAKAVEKRAERVDKLMKNIYENHERAGAAVADLGEDEIAIAQVLLSTDIPTQEPSQFFQSILPDSVVLHVSLSRCGLTLICATNDGIAAHHHSTITDMEMRRHVLDYLKLIKKSTDQSTDPDPKAAPRSPYSPTIARELTDIAARISTELITPVLDIIQKHKTVIFSPSHSLQKFPFSALLLDNAPIFLHKIIYSIPSLSALVHLQRSPRTASSTQLLSPTILTNPRTQCDIPLTNAQAHFIASLLGTSPLDTFTSTLAPPLPDPFKTSSLLYISTHGSIDPESPMHSSLDLHPKPLRVLDIVRHRTSAQLVVLNACWSGCGRETVGNDVSGFSHTILAAGARVFVGGLWSVYDWAGLIFMVEFFKELQGQVVKGAREGGGGEGVIVAECFIEAQRRLYNMTRDEMVGVLTEVQEGWKQAKANVSEEVYKMTREGLKHAVKDVGSGRIDVRFPSVWAPFVMVGDGALVWGC